MWITTCMANRCDNLVTRLFSELQATAQIGDLGVISDTNNLVSSGHLSIINTSIRHNSAVSSSGLCSTERMQVVGKMQKREQKCP